MSLLFVYEIIEVVRKKIPYEIPNHLGPMGIQVAIRVSEEG